MNLKKFNVAVCRFDSHIGLEAGETFVLPVDSLDEEHAVSAAMSNAVAFTTKLQSGKVLPVAFCCIAVESRP